MSTTADEDREKYTLVYYMPDDTDPASPPFKYRTYYLADAVEAAWRNHQAGGTVVSIVQEQRVVFSNGELVELFQRIYGMIPLTPERPLREIVEQAIGETGKE